MLRADLRMTEVLAIIPARGGSKGIPRKNLVSYRGEPLIVHSIRHALRATSITRTIVSTDDPEIAEVAQRAGAEVPFMRPTALAEDHVLDLPVFAHVLDELQAREGYLPELVVHLRPTTPHRLPGWIDEAVAALSAEPRADSLRSVSLVEQHPYRMFTIGEDGMLAAIMAHEHPMPYLLRRQELPPIYYYNCVLDVTRPRTVREQQSMTGRQILPFPLPAEEVIDIDRPIDLRLAEFLFGDRG
jgi:CMP-N,N'-diacetyllegionaminic acid synthase